jgi:hypothetical protein
MFFSNTKGVIKLYHLSSELETTLQSTPIDPWAQLHIISSWKPKPSQTPPPQSLPEPQPLAEPLSSLPVSSPRSTPVPLSSQHTGINSLKGKAPLVPNSNPFLVLPDESVSDPWDAWDQAIEQSHKKTKVSLPVENSTQTISTAIVVVPIE